MEIKLEVRYVPSHDRIADLLTKPLSQSWFEFLRSKLGVAEVLLPLLSLMGDIKEHGAPQLITIENCPANITFSSKLTDNGSTTPVGLVAASLAHSFALFVAVPVGANISDGHVNPTVTFGTFVGGHITLIRSILYWISQLLGSVETSAFALSSGVEAWNAMVFEIVMTFGLVCIIYTTAVDPKMGNIGIIAPIVIGFIVGANILVGGAFDGASMNPAVSFGPAAISWTWDSHWVYWLGPFIVLFTKE
ncbi:hypothetical protein DITRI_Ditri14bG0074500 [Diplodiscus trichospermus]